MGRISFILFVFHPSMHSSVHLSIHPFVHSFMPSFIFSKCSVCSLSQWVLGTLQQCRDQSMTPHHMHRERERELRVANPPTIRFLPCHPPGASKTRDQRFVVGKSMYVDCLFPGLNAGHHQTSILRSNAVMLNEFTLSFRFFNITQNSWHIMWTFNRMTNVETEDYYNCT